jgi:hypothetical protein
MDHRRKLFLHSWAKGHQQKSLLQSWATEGTDGNCSNPIHRTTHATLCARRFLKPPHSSMFHCVALPSTDTPSSTLPSSRRVRCRPPCRPPSCSGCRPHAAPECCPSSCPGCCRCPCARASWSSHRHLSRPDRCAALLLPVLPSSSPCLCRPSRPEHRIVPCCPPTLCTRAPGQCRPSSNRSID